MAKFIVRVELHGERDYTRLHSAMERRGFSRDIKGTDGKLCLLPPGTYRFESNNLNRSQVLRRAKIAAAMTFKRAAIMVTEGLTAWSGLDEVTRGQRGPVAHRR